MMSQDFSRSIYERYDNYKEKAIKKKNFRHSDIIPLIEKLKGQQGFTVKKAGESCEKRDIYLVSLGTGRQSVLLWSQMHGDESTATMAIFDIFNFFSKSDEFSEIKKKLLDSLTIHFIPMLNPDGAERFQRRNALNIDLNRDAIRLESPESRILKEIRDSLNPAFGFNLHDQSRKWAAGQNFKSASISFLAPPINYEKEVNPVRERAMKLIVELRNLLNRFIPGHIGKYSDDFEPRAFGDNIQKWGTSTVLIESGGWYNDREKQFLRQINFTAILSALVSIAEGSYTKNPLKAYYNIPDNQERIFDLLLRNITYSRGDSTAKVDIGINRYEQQNKNRETFYKSIIEDIGDLSTFYGYEDYNCDSLVFSAGREYPKVIEKYEELKSLDFESLLKKGYTAVRVKEGIPAESFSKYPVTILSASGSAKMDNPAPGNQADFVLKEKGRIKLAVINGFIINLSTSGSSLQNSVIVQ
ncbi:MAG: M14 metallopeptidase family protein [Syntrophothermus sp.]